MAQYHLKDNGDPALCRAAKGKCPKGGAHFDSEAEARAAVEELFGDSFQAPPQPLAVYTKTAVRNQFRGIFDPKTGRSMMIWDDGPFEAYGREHVRDAYNLLTESRLDVKSQNLKVRKQLEAKIASLQDLRDGRGWVGQELHGAVSLHYLSPILEEHYGIPDPRSEAQKAADEAFVTEYQKESSVLPHNGHPIIDVTAYDDDDLSYLANLKGREADQVSDEDLQKVYKLNKQAQESVRRWDFDNEAMDSWDYYRAVQDRRAKSETVSDEMQQYLRTEMQKETLDERLRQAREEILTVAPQNSWGNRLSDRAKPLAEVAQDLIELRKTNRKLHQGVLTA